MKLATFRQRLYLLKSRLSVCVGTFFPVEIIFENDLTVSVIAIGEELKEKRVAWTNLFVRVPFFARRQGDFINARDSNH